MHFGIGFKREATVPFVEVNNLGLVEKDEDGNYPYQSLSSAAYDAVWFLSWKYSYRIELVLPYSDCYNYVAAIYSNYDIDENLLSKERNDEILEAIRKAVGERNQPAMWFYDSASASGTPGLWVRARPLPHPRYVRIFYSMHCAYSIL
jgi:hypothetical protein